MLRMREEKLGGGVCELKTGGAEFLSVPAVAGGYRYDDALVSALPKMQLTCVSRY